MDAEWQTFNYIHYGYDTYLPVDVISRKELGGKIHGGSFKSYTWCQDFV